jgi:hypothetical protein
MMPVIRKSDATYEKHQRLAKPFVDTPEAVIARLADSALSGTTQPAARATVTTIPTLDPNEPGSLTHTRLRFAQIDGQVIDQPNWNKLSRAAHALAMTLVSSLDVLRHVSGANIRPGRYENEGFAYLADANISLQGQDSSGAWTASYAIAKELGFPIEVIVEWHNKDGAAFPGEQRRISWKPTDHTVR